MEEIKFKIFDFAYGAALGDATRQQAFNGKESSLRNCDKSKAIIREYVDQLLNGSEPNFYQTAQRVEKVFCDYMEQHSIDGTFRFGNVQKLINMTVKYLYIVVYANDSLRRNFNNCHCPMDSFMVERLIKELDGTPAERLPKQLADYKSIRGWKGYLRRPWSRISFDQREQYELFQEGIRFFAEQNGVSSVEYDYIAWKA